MEKNSKNIKIEYVNKKKVGAIIATAALVIGLLSARGCSDIKLTEKHKKALKGNNPISENIYDGNETEDTKKIDTYLKEMTDEELSEIKTVFENYNVPNGDSVLTNNGTQGSTPSGNSGNSGNSGSTTPETPVDPTPTDPEDQTAPEITGVEDGKYYNINLAPVITDDPEITATLNGVEYIPGTEITEEGNYTLVVTDKAGNQTTVTFVIDKTAPVITGIEKDGSYCQVTPVITDDSPVTATLNGVEYTPGTEITEEGNYTLIVTDKAGNTTTVNFEIVLSYAELVNGTTFNSQIKSLSSNIETIERSDAEPTTSNYVEVQAADSEYPIKMWVDENEPTRILWYTQATKIKLNSNSSRMFYLLTKLTTQDITNNVDTSNVTDMSYMFYGDVKLTELDVSSFDTSNVTTMNNMFYNCGNLTTLNVSSFKTSNVTTMNNMFYNCVGLTALDVSNFDASNVKDMSSMFRNCESLTSLNFGDDFDTSKVTSMSAMFGGCTSLIELDLSSFDTNNVSNMVSMFNGCSGLTALDLSSFDTSSAISMNSMFSGCSSLTMLNLSSFDTRTVTDMQGMFDGCTSLIELDLDNFDTRNVKTMNGMFFGDTNLTTIYVSDTFVTEQVTNSTNMFYGCSKLPGFDTSKIDKTHAVIGTPDAPGYFTGKEKVLSATEQGIATLQAEDYEEIEELAIDETPEEEEALVEEETPAEEETFEEEETPTEEETFEEEETPTEEETFEEEETPAEEETFEEEYFGETPEYSEEQEIETAKVLKLSL